MFSKKIKLWAATETDDSEGCGKQPNVKMS